MKWVKINTFDILDALSAGSIITDDRHDISKHRTITSTKPTIEDKIGTVNVQETIPPSIQNSFTHFEILSNKWRVKRK